MQAEPTSPQALDRAPLMRHNQKIGYEKLREEAEEARRKSGKTQTELAQELDKATSTISRALNESGAKFAKLQREIIEHLTDYCVGEEEVLFRVLRKEN